MKRATIYLDDQLHKALKLKAFETNESVSNLVNEAVRSALDEDLEDLSAIESRKKEKPISYASFLTELRSRGQI
jgi:hypothetical protein